MLLLAFFTSLLSIIFALFLIFKIKASPSGQGKMVKIQKAIEEGALAYLKRQYRTIFWVALILFFLLTIGLGFKIGLGFLMGALASALAGFIGMRVSTKTNLKVVESAKKGLRAAFELSFQGGAVTGFLVVGLGLLSICLLYLLTKDLKALIALGFGASLISVFARLGGGIYTKSADIGGDLVGKVEEKIPEDDPRNPAVIADQVGDNVGDCAGMAADLFETYLVTIVAAMVLGNLIFPQIPGAVTFPLYLASVAILASILASFFVKLSKNQNVLASLYKGLIGAGILAAIGFFPLIKNFSKAVQISPIKLYFSSLVGLIIVAFLFFINQYFTSERSRPTRSIAKAAETGPAINIISGLATGMRSTLPVIILISLGVLISYWLAGIYGLSLASLAMLSLAGLIVALDSYGPITDNAGGIAEMADLPREIRENTDLLDAAGNTTKSLSKTYAIASAGLAALVLFSAYSQEIINLGKEIQFLLTDPKVLIGLFIGALLPFYFSSLTLEAVARGAFLVVKEVRRQFREIEGILEGKVLPEYGKCVDIVTKAALKEMILPALLPVISVILVGFILGPQALGALLIGSIISGLLLAVFMAIGGAAWDNAKKYIEAGNLGGKGSLSHQAAVIGDTVGDPFKDTAGPAINPMIKVLNVIALLIVRFLV
jgi:K(+)-stimulated pyrophosphate-energized sodium pump